jgi:hypothetical protein
MPPDGHTDLCGICPFRETCTVYQHLLRDNYYRYPSWEAHHAQRRGAGREGGRGRRGEESKRGDTGSRVKTLQHRGVPSGLKSHQEGSKRLPDRYRW